MAAVEVDCVPLIPKWIGKILAWASKFFWNDASTIVALMRLLCHRLCVLINLRHNTLMSCTKQTPISSGFVICHIWKWRQALWYCNQPSKRPLTGKSTKKAVLSSTWIPIKFYPLNQRLWLAIKPRANLCIHKAIESISLQHDSDLVFWVEPITIHWNKGLLEYTPFWLWNIPSLNSIQIYQWPQLAYLTLKVDKKGKIQPTSHLVGAEIDFSFARGFAA